MNLRCLPVKPHNGQIAQVTGPLSGTKPYYMVYTSETEHWVRVCS